MALKTALAFLNQKQNNHQNNSTQLKYVQNQNIFEKTQIAQNFQIINQKI